MLVIGQLTCGNGVGGGGVWVGGSGNGFGSDALYFFVVGFGIGYFFGACIGGLQSVDQSGAKLFEVFEGCQALVDFVVVGCVFGEHIC